MGFEIVLLSLIEVVIARRFLFRAHLIKESRTGVGFPLIYMV